MSILKKVINFFLRNKKVHFLLLFLFIAIVRYFPILDIIIHLLLITVVGLLYQLLFPVTPLKAFKVFNYTIAIILLVLTLSIIDNKVNICKMIENCRKVLLVKAVLAIPEQIIKKDTNDSK